MKFLKTIFLLALATPLHADNWMKRLPDDTYVANLSIPGSHDTGTGNGFPGATTSIYGPFGDKYARTQEKNFEAQWNLGVRAFDMRPAVTGNYLNDNHGIMPTKLRFDDALYFLRDKLRENPSEFAIIHLLHATAGDDNASNYGERLLELVRRDDLKDFFVDFSPTLTVKQMRGKILLLSRDHYADKPVGGFFLNWTGDLDWNAQRRGQIVGAKGATASLYMQDYAETFRQGDLERKVNGVRQLLEFSTKHKANLASDIVWVCNFASAYSKVSRLYIPLIVDEQISSSDGYRDNAVHTNGAILDYLNDPSNPAGPTGIILADYVGVNSSNGYNTRGQELVDAIIANNFRYLKDMSQVTEEDATYRKPLDMTARIVNPGFNSNMLSGWDGDKFGAVNPNENAEHFNRNFDTWQTITDLPNGVYAIGVKAFYRPSLAEEANRHYRLKDRALRNARLYAVTGSDSTSFPIVSPFSKSVVKAKGVGREISVKVSTLSYFIPDDMIAAEYYMHALNAYANVVFAAVNNHQLTIGVKKHQSVGMDWCVFDDFTLTYYGNTELSYRTWLTEMKKKKLNYASVTVSECYNEAYSNAFSVIPANRDEAIDAMKAIDVAGEEIALNAELWDEYKQAAQDVNKVLDSGQYSDESKDFLRYYYENTYLRNLTECKLTNQQLMEAMNELRIYIIMTCTGEWTGIPQLKDDSVGNSDRQDCWTIHGQAVNAPQRPGLYIMRRSDGTTKKMLVK